MAVAVIPDGDKELPDPLAGEVRVGGELRVALEEFLPEVFSIHVIRGLLVGGELLVDAGVQPRNEGRHRFAGCRWSFE